MTRSSAFVLCLALAGAVCAQGPRARIRFDRDWKFRQDPARSASASPFAWEWKRADSTSLDSWKLPEELSTDGWKPAVIGENVFRGRGFAWFRANLGTGTTPPAVSLHFESVDDNALVFLNGVRLLRHDGWDDPFDVPMARSWKAGGPNTLTLLVQNTQGEGGIMGDVEWKTPIAEPREATASFDDRSWRTVHLPHDFVVEGQFDRRADTSHGSLPVGAAWYRKSFSLPESAKGRRVWVDFDGVYRDSSVWLNGHFMGRRPSGYIGFQVDLTPFVIVGGRNVLAVRVDARHPEGWWYEGGGIYRHVWLTTAEPVHVKPWSTYVTTDVRGKADATAVQASTIVTNESGRDAQCRVRFRVTDPEGRLVAASAASCAISKGGEVSVSSKLALRHARLWSLESPNLYRLHLEVVSEARLVDAESTAFGVRTIAFDANKGFFLNGKPVKLKGTCNHQDHAGVGVAMPDGLLDWRIRQLKKMGSNAYRCSHNPVASELLDACDRLGMLVMDENRHLGDATQPKSSMSTKADNLSELRDMVLRDRNHPSVIMWSMSNEEPIQASPAGAKIFTAMKALTHRLDPTRPVTAALNFGWDSGMGPLNDLIGFNYSVRQYERIHKKYPTIPLYGSETASTVSSRGIYANNVRLGYVSAYDINKPGWGNTAEEAWKPIAERPWMAGGFVWTGFDYKGEPTPYGWPCINSHFGILDICGFPKDNAWYYRAWWGDKPIVHILPHWNWVGQEEKPIEVWCYSNADQVELFLNGKSLGSQAMPPYEHLVWQVPFTPGALVAKAYRAGKLIATDRVETTGKPAALRIRTERPELVADSEDLSPVEIEVVDSAGRRVPDASNLVRFSVVGSGRVVGVGNGDPSSHEPDKASQRHAFNGLCMALVGSKAQPGVLRVIASAEGLKPAELKIQVRKTPLEDR